MPSHAGRFKRCGLCADAGTGCRPKHPFGVGGCGRRTAGRSACPSQRRENRSSEARPQLWPKAPEKRRPTLLRVFPGFVGKATQIASRAETRRRIPVQRRVILCDRYGLICRDIRDSAEKSTASTLSHTCWQRHSRDTSETEQRQKRFVAEDETQMYQCFPQSPPRLYRLPHIFFTTLRL